MINYNLHIIKKYKYIIIPYIKNVIKPINGCIIKYNVIKFIFSV